MACLLALALLAAASNLHAAEEHTLGPDGTWQQTDAPDPDSAEGQLLAVRKLLADEKWDKARAAAEDWQKRYPNHPLWVEAKLAEADARRGDGNYLKALFDYEAVIRLYPASEAFNIALEREFEIAKAYLEGKRKKTGPFRLFTAYTEGTEIMIRIQERVPGSELGERASLYLGDFYFRKGEMDMAMDAYDLFLINYPDSIHRERAMLRLIKAALATFKGPRYDSSGLIEAEQRLRQYSDEYPAQAQKLGVDALLVRIEESHALKTLHEARWYDKRGEDVSAIYLYQRVIREHPQTAAAQAAKDRLEDMDAPVVAEEESDQRDRQPEMPSEPMPETEPIEKGQ